VCVCVCVCVGERVRGTLIWQLHVTVTSITSTEILLQ